MPRTDGDPHPEPDDPAVRNGVVVTHGEKIINTFRRTYQHPGRAHYQQSDEARPA